MTALFFLVRIFHWCLMKFQQNMHLKCFCIYFPSLWWSNLFYSSHQILPLLWRIKLAHNFSLITGAYSIDFHYIHTGFQSKIQRRFLIWLIQNRNTHKIVLLSFLLSFSPKHQLSSFSQIFAIKAAFVYFSKEKNVQDKYDIPNFHVLADARVLSVVALNPAKIETNWLVLMVVFKSCQEVHTREQSTRFHSIRSIL